MGSLEPSTFLVVGGTGFIGRHIISSLRTTGCQVDSLSLGKPQNGCLEKHARYLVGDLSDKSALTKALSGKRYEFVINCGGYIDHRRYSEGGSEVFSAHFHGLMNLIDVLDWSKLRRFIQIGSSDEYGGQPAPQLESVREDPISPYSLAKVAGTHFLQMLHKTEQFPVVIVRLFLTYGPGQDSHRFIPQVVNACQQGKPFPVSSGEQHRDFLYIDDAVKAIKKTLYCDRACGEVLNIASGKGIRVRDVIELVRTYIGRGHPLYGEIPFRPGESMTLYADIEKSKKLLSWSPNISLETGIKRVVESAVLPD